MTDSPPEQTLEMLNFAFTEDEVRAWLHEWERADARTRRDMEAKAVLVGLNRSHGNGALRDDHRAFKDITDQL